MPIKHSANDRDIHRGRELARRRKLSGLSQERLAAKLQISLQQLSKYERGINRIPINSYEDAIEAIDEVGSRQSGFSEAVQSEFIHTPADKQNEIHAILSRVRQDIDVCLSRLAAWRTGDGQ